MLGRLLVSACLAVALCWGPGASSAVTCDGVVTQVLSGTQYCSGGERVGFMWSGGSDWLCSSNKNMDALLLVAYTTGKTISVRDSNWTTCNQPAGSVPGHIWFKE